VCVCVWVCLFKMDFEKAYDSVSWQFLFYMMRRMGFHDRWIGWNKGCLTSAFISILVNGSRTSKFKPQRGLRQGEGGGVGAYNYLGLAIGINLRRKVVWEPIIMKLEPRLNKSNHRSISMAGRITLINFVFKALPLFYLSFFRAPSVVINRLTAIQRNFFLGWQLRREEDPLGSFESSVCI